MSDVSAGITRDRRNVSTAEQYLLFVSCLRSEFIKGLFAKKLFRGGNGKFCMYGRSSKRRVVQGYVCCKIVIVNVVIVCSSWRHRVRGGVEIHCNVK